MTLLSETELRAKIGAAVDAAGLRPVSEGTATRLGIYIALIQRWNARVNLTAIRDEGAIIDRHLVEAVFVSERLPASVRTLLDFGSGAGLPGIPIAICRPDVQVTLAESQNKKAAFLMEAVRVLDLSSTVYSGRAEELKNRFDCVILRAVDRMAASARAAESLVAPGGWLALMTTESGLVKLQAAASADFKWARPQRLPCGERRLLALAQRQDTR